MKIHSTLSEILNKKYTLFHKFMQFCSFHLKLGHKLTAQSSLWKLQMYKFGKKHHSITKIFCLLEQCTIKTFSLTINMIRKKAKALRQCCHQPSYLSVICHTEGRGAGLVSFFSSLVQQFLI